MIVNYTSVWSVTYDHNLQSYLKLAKASQSYDHSFKVLATVITIVNYDHKTFIVQAAGAIFTQHYFPCNLQKGPISYIVYVLGRLLQPSLIFVGKARSLSQCGFSTSFYLQQKYETNKLECYIMLGWKGSPLKGGLLA
jgi:hypothetical protein